MNNKEKLAVILLCSLVGVNAYQIHSLDNQIENLERQLNQQTINTEGRISNIYSNVSQMLEEEANELAKAEVQYGAANVEARTATVTVSVTPKSYTPGETRVFAVLEDGKSYPLTYEKGQYAGQLSVPLMEETMLEQIQLVDGDKVRVQQLERTLSPSQELLLRDISVYPSFGSNSCTYQKDTVTWSVSYMPMAELWGAYEGEVPDIAKIELVELRDGREIGNRMAVDLSKEAQQQYASEAQKMNNFAMPEILSEDSGQREEQNFAYIYWLKEKYVLPHGSKIELWMELTDSYGLVYHCFLDGLAVSPEGIAEPVVYDGSPAGAQRITDSQGNELWNWENEAEVSY